MPPRQPPYLERERMASKPEFAEQPQRKKPAEKPKKEPSYEDSQYSYEPKNLTKPTRKVDINYQQQSFDNSTFAFPQPVTKRQEFYQEENQDDYTSASGNNTWRRTYVLPNERPGLVKNRITTSSEILAEELPYGPDVSAIKSAFIPKPESKPQIQRVGRRWQPPPEEPPILPRRRNPLYSPTPADDAFHLWQPHLRQPEYKYERKNFTPPNSPVLDYQQKTTTPSHNKTRSIEHTDDFNWTNFETPRQQQRQRYSRDNSTDMEDNSSLDVRMRVVQPNLNQQRNVTSSTLQSNRSHLVSTPVQTDDNSPLTRGKRTQDSIIPRGLIDDSSLIRGRRPSQDSLHSSKSAPESQRRREYFSLGNEPTDRHPSTVTNRDRLKIDISRRIRLYEPSLKQQNKSAAPARTAKRPTSTVSVDEDTSDVDSRLSDRAVRFADRSNVVSSQLIRER